MPLGNKFTFHRGDNRILMEIPVCIDGHRQVPGARVVSVRRWEQGEKLTFASRTGDFRSTARVAYCQPLQGDGFAIGVEFLEPKGRWVVQSPR